LGPDVQTDTTADATMKAVFPAFDGLAMTFTERRSVSRDGLAAKRRLDIAIAALALLLLAPLLALVALAVKLDSAGPVIFAQRRSGLGGRTFAILKFRSMRVTEDGAEVKQAVSGDARITAVGRIIRKLSIDELPQLFNVLAGDMSLVGPRPHAKAHDDYYSVRISNYAERFRVKPGITGWAQVNGARGETPTLAAMQDRINLDAWYARNRSGGLDLKILARTPLVVLSMHGAG
jgi:putative colanic acid biosynthesis UDP-glucose lipid carrier transferase